MTDEAKKIVDALEQCSICDSDTVIDAIDLIEGLSAELEKTKLERDAAVKDIPRACGYCKHFKQDVECCDIPGCCDNPNCWNISGVNTGWQWRGVCAENCRSAQE